MVNVPCMVVRLIACLACLAVPAVARPADQSPTITHHTLSVELQPNTHTLTATDTLHVQVPAGGGSLIFSLAPSLRVDHIVARSADAGDGRNGRTLSFERPAGEQNRVSVRLPDTSSAWILEWHYSGPIDDPPRDPRHLRFVTPSETSGHIGPEGVYLSSESGWYPDLPGSLATYELKVVTPAGWATVSQGAEAEDPGHWTVTTRSEALTLVANRFTVTSRDWQSASGQKIRLATYLFPEDAHLADEYLDASARYLDAYIPLLRAYPFPKFAVVENFFSSGLGMPSFTLLGAAVIKRHYTQPYALGHEIVHSWIGNGIYNRVDHGNWVEGLTTYLANYYWHEIMGEPERAKEQRRLMLYGYAVYVQAERDYPVTRFRQKSDERDNAIGYQKAAMIFHMLRREVGESAFWAGLKDLVAAHLGTYADWHDIERVFGARHGRELRWFFSQWVERPGAPIVTIADALVRRSPDRPAAGDYLLAATLVQQAPVYRIPIEVQLEQMGQDPKMITVEMVELRQPLSVVAAEPVRALTVDPDFHLFRRLERRQLPPMLNLFVTDGARAIASGPMADGERNPLAGIVARVKGQEAGHPDRGRTQFIDTSHIDGMNSTGSILFLGHDSLEAQAAVRTHCGDRFEATPAGFRIDGETYEGPTMAVLVSCARRGVPGSVVTLLHGVTPEALSKVARLLFFYGWHSYVVFKEGVVVKRGDWDMSMKREVTVDEP